DAGELDHGAHGAARADPGSGRRRLQQFLRRPLLETDLVGNGGPDHGHCDEMLLRRLYRLADGLRHLPCRAQPGADAAVLVADHDQRAEGEATAALDDLRHPVQVDDLLCEFRLTSAVLVTHLFLTQNFNPALRAASASALIRP